MASASLWSLLGVALAGWVRANGAVLGGLVRALLAAGGGWLVNEGVASMEDVEAISTNGPALVGGGLFVATAVWSWLSKLRKKEG